MASHLSALKEIINSLRAATHGDAGSDRRGGGSSSPVPAPEIDRLFAEADARKRATYSDDDLARHIFGDC